MPGRGRSVLGTSRAAALALLATAALDCTDRPDASGLDCVFDPRVPVTECPHLRDHQEEQPLTLSDTAELVVEGLSASRTSAGLAVDVRLAGRFWNEIDQNLYLFVGGPLPASGKTTYALSADPAYAADVGYPVRGAIEVPHAIDVRVGVMAPGVRRYTPQVYLDDPVHAVAVGEGAITALRSAGGEVHLEVPIERYYAARGIPVPDHLGVTVATARDYVGFVDQRTVRDLPPGATAAAAPGDVPPFAYPLLDPRSHRFERVAMRPASGGVSVEIEMAAPVTDWAQTNLHFFFLPVPAYPSSKPLPDPSMTRSLPSKWSFYCAVYSPRRVFCKASNGKDFTFDTAYAERATLASPPGVTFRELGGARYALDLGAEHADTLRAGRPTFAIMVSAGRDGFSPTTWYGAVPHRDAPP